MDESAKKKEKVEKTKKKERKKERKKYKERSEKKKIESAKYEIRSNWNKGVDFFRPTQNAPSVFPAFDRYLMKL